MKINAKVNNLKRLSQIILSFNILGIATFNSSFAYTSFKLTRKKLDTFENPTVTKCDWELESQKFCRNRQSSCGSQGCCSCQCEYGKATFDRFSLECRKNKDFRTGCDLLFKDIYIDQPLKLLDLSSDDDEEVVWDRTANNDQFQCDIDSIVFFHGGLSVGNNKFLSVEKIVKNENWRRLIKIKWDDENIPKGSHGKVFRVNIRCNIRRKEKGRLKTYTERRCFVFKAAGTLTINRNVLSTSTSSFASNIPELSPTTLGVHGPHSPSSLNLEQPLSPTTSSVAIFFPTPSFSLQHEQTLSSTPSVLPQEPSIIESSPVSLNIPRTVLPTESNKQSIVVSSTPNEAATSKPGGGDPNADQQSGKKGSNTAVISSLIVVCVVLLVAFLLYILWRKRRSARLQEKSVTPGVSNQGAAINNDGINMGSLENIYAEADVKNSKFVEKGNQRAYDYAVNHYASLHKDAQEEKDNYQPLNIDNGKNLYECIPAQKTTHPLAKTGSNNPPVVSEPFYHSVEDAQTTDTGATTVDNMYNVLDGPDTSCETSNQVSFNNERDERVYSILEDDQHDTEQQPEDNYLVVLPTE